MKAGHRRGNPVNVIHSEFLQITNLVISKLRNIIESGAKYFRGVSKEFLEGFFRKPIKIQAHIHTSIFKTNLPKCK